MTWRLEYAKRVAKRLRDLPLGDHRRIVEALDSMEADPLAGDVKALIGQPAAFRRRVGNYRILFDIDPAERVVLVLDVARRSSTTYRRR